MSETIVLILMGLFIAVAAAIFVIQLIIMFYALLLMLKDIRAEGQR